jgi:hypothetical protein
MSVRPMSNKVVRSLRGALFGAAVVLSVFAVIRAVQGHWSDAVVEGVVAVALWTLAIASSHFGAEGPGLPS